MKTTDASNELMLDELARVSGGLTFAEAIFGVGVAAGYAVTTHYQQPTVGEIARRVVNSPK
jgi:hypothetical protein